MLFMWGSRQVVKDIREDGRGHCARCEAERPFKIVLRYKYFHLWYLLRMVTSKSYHRICEVCLHGPEIEKRHVEATLKANPIPFGTRYGMAFGAALIAGFIGLGAKFSHDQDLLTEEYAGAPQVNDLYVANVARFLKDPKSPYAYAVLKIRNLSDGRVQFDIGSSLYNKASGPRKDITSGKANSEDYYSDNLLTLAPSEIQAMRKDGAISQITRSKSAAPPVMPPRRRPTIRCNRGT